MVLVLLIVSESSAATHHGLWRRTMFKLWWRQQWGIWKGVVVGLRIALKRLARGASTDKVCDEYTLALGVLLIYG